MSVSVEREREGWRRARLRANVLPHVPLDSLHPASMKPGARRADRRRGASLIELVVVLALLGVAAALAGPSLATPRAERTAVEAVRSARALALRRAETVRFAMGGDGEWRAHRWEAARGEAPLLSGRVRGAVGRALALRITPLGACLPLASPEAESWDPLACAPAREAR